MILLAIINSVTLAGGTLVTILRAIHSAVDMLSEGGGFKIRPFHPLIQVVIAYGAYTNDDQAPEAATSRVGHTVAK